MGRNSFLTDSGDLDKFPPLTVQLLAPTVIFLPGLRFCPASVYFLRITGVKYKGSNVPLLHSCDRELRNSRSKPGVRHEITSLFPVGRNPSLEKQDSAPMEHPRLQATDLDEAVSTTLCSLKHFAVSFFSNDPRHYFLIRRFTF